MPTLVHYFTVFSTLLLYNPRYPLRHKIHYSLASYYSPLLASVDPVTTVLPYSTQYPMTQCCISSQDSQLAYLKGLICLLFHTTYYSLASPDSLVSHMTCLTALSPHNTYPSLTNRTLSIAEASAVFHPLPRLALIVSRSPRTETER
jgi:hypothetical protein